MASETVMDRQASSATIDDGADAELATAEVEILREENERLREEFRRAKRTTYQRTTLAFALLGGFAIAGALFFPAMGTVLTALGGASLFGAVLTYFITPEEFLAASVSEQLQRTTADNWEQVTTELGLKPKERLYTPISGQTVRMFVPAHRNFSQPADDALRSVFVVTEDERERGIAVTPCGANLYEEFDTASRTAEDVERFVAQLAEAVVEQFELADSVTSAVSADGNDARFEISGAAIGQLDRFDHPIVSLLAVGLAVHQDASIQVEISGDRADAVVRCVWGGDSPSEDSNDRSTSTR